MRKRKNLIEDVGKEKIKNSDQLYSLKYTS